MNVPRLANAERGTQHLMGGAAMHKSNNILLINEQFTAVYPSLVKTVNSLTLAVVLQTIHFKSQLTDDGWVHCSMQEIADITGLSRDGVQRAMIKLRQMNLLFEDHESGYNNSKSWKIDLDILNEMASTALSQDTRNRTTSPAKSQSKHREIADSTITKELVKNIKESTRTYGDEVIELSNLLADLIEANGIKRPSVTEKWHQEIERLNRIDGYSWQQIEATIRWVQNDSFWRSNVLSPGKLRKQFGALQLKMKGSGGLSGWAKVIAKFENEQREIEK